MTGSSAILVQGEAVFLVGGDGAFDFGRAAPHYRLKDMETTRTFGGDPEYPGEIQVHFEAQAESMEAAERFKKRMEACDQIFDAIEVRIG